jgi:GNAT superfamily N-acetyltransferase
MNNSIKTKDPDVTIRFAIEEDVPLILSLIKGIAEYEKLLHEVIATEVLLSENLFGKRRTAEVILAYYKNEPAGFALFFHNFSTFVGKPGIYLEDIFIKPELRGKGIGKILLAYLGKLAIERDCGRIEWSVLDWNESAIQFYKKLGALPMEEWTVFRITSDRMKNLASYFEEV